MIGSRPKHCWLDPLLVYSGVDRIRPQVHFSFYATAAHMWNYHGKTCRPEAFMHWLLYCTDGLVLQCSSAKGCRFQLAQPIRPIPKSMCISLRPTNSSKFSSKFAQKYAFVHINSIIVILTFHPIQRQLVCICKSSRCWETPNPRSNGGFQQVIAFNPYKPLTVGRVQGDWKTTSIVLAFDQELNKNFLCR